MVSKQIIRRYLPLVISAVFQYVNSTEAQQYLKDTYSASAIEDAYSDTLQLLTKYNYPAENHYVTTTDQYILNLHRIPNPKGRPVLMVHGLMDSSATWILMGPSSGPGYYLHNEGYDVWLGNVRGNRYSRNHTTLNPSTDETFWTFSFHEIGYYDVPAMVDYILKTTGHSKLAYFGHSQGTTSFWVMCSMRPEYNEKISIMQALAPVAFTKHNRCPLTPYFNNFVKLSKDRVRELLPHTFLFLESCFRSKVAEEICINTFWQMMGKDTESMNMTLLPVVLGHVPAGCNLKQWEHFLQFIESDRFALFDYGDKENQERYGSLTPPDYPLEKITAPVALHYAHNDYFSDVIDVQHLAKLLPNVVEDHLYPNKNWNHMTVLWGIEAHELVHKPIVKMMKNYV